MFFYIGQNKSNNKKNMFKVKNMKNNYDSDIEVIFLLKGKIINKLILRNIDLVSANFII